MSKPRIVGALDRKELARRFSERTPFSQKESKIILDAYLNLFCEQLIAGEALNLGPFGQLSTKVRVHGQPNKYGPVVVVDYRMNNALKRGLNPDHPQTQFYEKSRNTPPFKPE